MFRHDAGRSGRADSPLPALSGIAWAVDLGAPVDCAPAVAGGSLYAATTGGTVCALEVTSGAERWRTDLRAAVVSSPCVDAARVYFGCTDGNVYALDVATGERVWSARTGRSVIAPPLLCGGSVLIGSTDGRLYAFAADTGSLLWRTTAGGEVHAGAAVAGELVVYGDWSHKVHCVRLSDGAAAWPEPYDAEGPVLACPVIAGEVVVVGVLVPTALSPGNCLNVHVVDLASGRRLWGAPGKNRWQTDKEGSMSVATSPTVVGDQVWFLTGEGYGNWSAALRSVALATGARGAALTSRRGQEGFVFSDSSAALVGSVLHMADYNGTLFQFDTATQRVLGSIALGARTVSSPAISDGRVFIGLADGKLVCVG
jgi:outer membrane protein assembly factor BamB